MNIFRSRKAARPSRLVLILLVASLLLIQVHADPASDTGLPKLSTATESSTSSTSSSSSSSTSTSSSSSTSTSSTSSTTSTSTTQSQTTSTNPGLPPLTTSTSTTSSQSQTTSTGTGLPPLTTSTTGPTDFPTATVPPTANAPYMSQSSLPEGTVFIAVGAGLGFIGLSVLIWRAMVAWSINRSVRKAAYQQANSDVKAAAVMRRSSKRKSRRSTTTTSGRRRSQRRETRGTSMNMEKLPPRSDRHSHVSTKTPATQSSLFFSPTAGAGAAGSHQSLNRASTYLPAGYYAAGNTAMGSHSQVNLGRSPPGTPTSPPSRGFDAPFNRGSHHLAASTSSLNLNAPHQGRVPSAYLEDLFDSHSPNPRP